MGADATGGTVFVFPGQGNQWPSMGTDAYRQLPAYRAEADRSAQAFVEAGLQSPLPYLIGERQQNWSRTEIQGAQFIHAVSLAAQWRFHGMLPDITVGHSLGEVAAAYVAGADHERIGDDQRPRQAEFRQHIGDLPHRAGRDQQ